MPVDSTYTTGDLIKEGKLRIGDGYRAKNEELAPHGLPFARAGNINCGFHFKDADRFPEEDLEKVGEKISRPGDVVFTSKGTVGRFAFVKPSTPRFVFAPQLSYWRSLDPDLIHPRYLYYWIQGSEFWLQAAGVKSQTDMADYVSLTDQRRMRITLPDIERQRAIASTLGALDDTIELNRKTNRTLESLAQTIFNSWFVDFDPVITDGGGNDPVRLSDELVDLFPDRLVESEIGQIPLGWKLSRLGDLVEEVPGRSYKSKELQPSDTALVSLRSFRRGGGYREGGLKPYTGNYAERQVVKPGEVVVARTDVTQAAEVIGTALRVPRSSHYETLVASLDLLILRPKDLSKQFLYHLAMTDEWKNHMVARSSGTTVLHLSKDAISSFRFARSPLALETSFSEVAEKIYSLVQRNREESRTLAEIRDALLPKLLSGEIPVAQAEKAVEAVGA